MTDPKVNARRKNASVSREDQGHFSLVGRTFMDLLDPGKDDPPNLFSVNADRPAEDFSDPLYGTWDEVVFYKDQLGEGNNYQSLMCVNWACFAFLPAWLRSAGTERLTDVMNDLKESRITPGSRFEAPISTSYFDNKIREAHDLVEAADQLTSSPLTQLRKFDRNRRLAKKLDRAEELARTFYADSEGSTIKSSREADERLVSLSSLAWANIGAAAEGAAKRMLDRSAAEACDKAIAQARLEVGEQAPSWASLGHRAIGLGASIAYGIGLKAAREAATKEDLELFTPPSRGIDEWEMAVRDPSTSIAVAVQTRLGPVCAELRRHAFCLLVEMVEQSGYLVDLFDGLIPEKTKEWDELTTAAKERIAERQVNS